MKTVLRSFLLIFILMACEQRISETLLPETIKTKFITLYPKAKNVHWGKEIKTYEVSFMNDKTPMEVSFDIDGNVSEVETEVKNSELPDQVIAEINSKFSYAEIQSYHKVERHGQILYEADMIIPNYAVVGEG